jgi:hypothetical protein
MKKRKRILISAVLILVLAGYIGCYAYLPIDGTVVDANTKQPIEGAVVLVEWTITRGESIGLPVTETYEVFETVTDKDGRFKIETSVANPFVNEPDVTIYKAGYICWNNKYIFPDYEHRKEFKWKNNNIYYLKPFPEEFTHLKHLSFIHDAADAPREKRPLMNKAIAWEIEKARDERRKLYKGRK